MTLKEKCPILQFADLGDERGKLVVIEGAQAIPFDIKRVFYIYDSDDAVIRGQHANRESEFVLINVAGKSKVRITDGTDEIIVELNKPMMGVYIPKMIWKDMYDFSSDSVLLVLASTHYDGAEYIRNYKDYITTIHGENVQTAEKALTIGMVERADDAERLEQQPPLLSLCMPTNGVPDWVFPSLDSIYAQCEQKNTAAKNQSSYDSTSQSSDGQAMCHIDGIDENLFEIVIMDNGNNQEFRQQLYDRYESKHKNLHYYHTEKPLFLSEPESYKKAQGTLIKFINHRNIMESGSIQYFIDCVKKYEAEKPVIYFSNGTTRQGNDTVDYPTFGSFVEALGYYSTWSSGMAIWKTDMDKMQTYEDFNFLFPHTDILFSRRKDKKYIIDGSNLWHEIPQGKKPKGNYNVFYAFAVEFPYIILQLLRDGDISLDEFLSVKRQNLDFLSSLYASYIVMRRYCCYDLTDYKKNLSIYYSKKEITKNMIKLFSNRTASRLKKVWWGGGTQVRK